MKLLDRAQFLQLPAGTLFTRYHPARNGFHQAAGTEPQDPFGELCIKGASTDNAFSFAHLAVPLSARGLNDLDNSYQTLIHEVIGGSLYLDLEAKPQADDSDDGVFTESEAVAKLGAGQQLEPEELAEALKDLDSIPLDELDPQRVWFLAWDAEDMMQLIAQLVSAIRALVGDTATDDALRSLLPTSTE